MVIRQVMFPSDYSPICAIIHLVLVSGKPLPTHLLLVHQGVVMLALVLGMPSQF